MLLSKVLFSLVYLINGFILEEFSNLVFSEDIYKDFHELPLQITTIGRYGGSTTRSRIPIGCFYGHTTLLPWEVDAYNKELGVSLGTEKAGVLSQLGTLVRVQ